MGKGGTILLINGTKYTWKLGKTHSYQMNAWDNNFGDVAPFTVKQVYIEWNEAAFKNSSDDSGEAPYTIQGTNLTFEVQARASNGYHLQVEIKNFSTLGNAQGSTIDIGWRHDGYAAWILSGDAGSFVSTSTNAIGSWMQKNIQNYGTRCLNKMCIPGSHDSGMSVSDSKTLFADNSNTITQTKKISDQLNCGVRYFDIRPVIGGGKYYTGHYSIVVDVTWQGARGESIDNIIAEINDFTKANNELIILDLSHAYDTDAGNNNYPDFNLKQWYGLFDSLKKINHLFITDKSNLTEITLNEYIYPDKKAQPAVLILVSVDIDLGDYAKEGFYLSSKHFSIYNSYSGTDDLNQMKNDQISKMNTYSQEQYFLLSWTLTQTNTQATLGTKSILDLADTADQGLLANASTLLTQMSAKHSYPNIIMIDNVTNSDVTSLANTLNLYIGQLNLQDVIDAKEDVDEKQDLPVVLNMPKLDEKKAANFLGSCSSVSLVVDGTKSCKLKANAKKADGSTVANEVDLSKILGNNDGVFDCLGQNFNQTAQNISLQNSRLLRCDLKTAKGDWKFAEIDLNLYLTNNDGQIQPVH